MWERAEGWLSIEQKSWGSDRSWRSSKLFHSGPQGRGAFEALVPATDLATSAGLPGFPEMVVTAKDMDS